MMLVVLSLYGTVYLGTVKTLLLIVSSGYLCRQLYQNAAHANDTESAMLFKNCRSFEVNDLYAITLPNSSNCTCGSSNDSEHYQHPFSTTVFIIVCVTAFVSAILTWWKYNSVTVLNQTVHPGAISNVPWIVYFSIICVRTLVDAVFYARFDKFIKAEFITDAVLKAVEVLFLVVALNYQRRHRYGGFLQDELSRFNAQLSTSQQSTRSSHIKIPLALCRIILSSRDIIFIIQFLLTILFLILLEVLQAESKALCSLYWTYMAVFWSLCASSIVLVIMVAVQSSSDDGTTPLTKVLFVAGVLFSLFGDIPTYVWRKALPDFCRIQHWCTRNNNWVMTPYNLSLLAIIISLGLFVAALRREFIRLSQEAQWDALDRAESCYSADSVATLT